MYIPWNSRTVADVVFRSVHGVQVIGAFGLGLSLEFKVQNWPAGELPPQVTLDTSPVSVIPTGKAARLLGYAIPDDQVPFRVGPYGSTATTAYRVLLSSHAMAELESIRCGQGIVMAVKLNARVSDGSYIQVVRDDVSCRISQSDWLTALEQCSYGRSLLFEVPISVADGSTDVVFLEVLDGARRHLLKGHYGETVAACRMVLESLTKELAEGPALQAARDLQKIDAKSMTVEQRELMLRQAAVHYANLAHHVEGASPNSLYDRSSAQMILSMTASLVSSALQRQVVSTQPQ